MTCFASGSAKINLFIWIDRIRASRTGRSSRPISVCIPCYEMHGKGVEFLRRLLDSLCKQTFKDFEVVISDQSKTSDAICQCAKDYGSVLNIVYIKHLGSSASSNMNHAIKSSSHELIKPLFQDDFLINSHALFEVSQCERGWGASHFIHTNQSENRFFNKRIPRWDDAVLSGMNFIGCPSVIHFFKSDQTYFDDKLEWLMDCEFYYLLYRIYGEPKIYPSLHLCVRLWDDSVTHHISAETKKKEEAYVRLKYGYRPVMHGNAISNKFSNYSQQVSISVDSIVKNDIAPYRVFLQLEPPDVVNLIPDIIEQQDKYHLILAWNQAILNACPNAELFPFGTCWLENVEVDIKKKTFSVSFLMSSKQFTEGHQRRHEIYNMLPNRVGQLEIIRHKSPPRIPDKATLLKPFQYSIIVENARYENYFTEKIIDCLVSKTIPIYDGCPNVEKFFNQEGILAFNNYNELEKILTALSPEKYFSMQNAIEDNYQRALEYVNIWRRVDKSISKRI